MRFRVQLREMAADEIASMIPAETMAEIKAADPHPVFRAFVVGHEGEARGNMVGVGNVVKRWYRNAVERLHERIAAGLQLFSGHAETNSTEGRTPIGRVVGKRLMRIGDRLSAVVACYVAPAFRHLPFDVASIEADVVMERDRGGLRIAEVDRVTGIALGNSRVNTPGFAGATLLGELQAFAAKGDQLMDITLEDVRAFLSQEKVKPSDLFGPEVLAADPIIAGMREKSPSNYEFARMRRELGDAEKKVDTLEREKQALADKVKTQDGELSASRQAAAKQKVGQLFEAQRTSRKLDERQAKYVQQRLERFKPEKPEDVEKEFNSWLDGQVDDYAKDAEVFGVQKPADKPKPGAEPGNEDKKKSSDPADKYLDPEQNKMIKLL